MLHASAQLEGTCVALIAAWARLMIRGHQAGLSEASDFQDSVMMLKVFQGDLQAFIFLESFSLPSDCALALAEFFVE